MTLFRPAIRCPGATRSNEPAGAAVSATHFFQLSAPVSAVDHVLGPEHAPVTVVEYADFECPNCKQAAAPVKLLLERFAGQVRFAFRHSPLEEVHPTRCGRPKRPNAPAARTASGRCTTCCSIISCS